MPRPSGVFVVAILGARDLPDMDGPYCDLNLGAMEKRTSITSGSGEVDWGKGGEAFWFPIDHPELQKLEVELFDEDTLSRDDLIGRTVVEVGDVAENGGGEEWRKLAGKDGGKEGNGMIHLATSWLTPTTERRRVDDKITRSGEPDMMLCLFVGTFTLGRDAKP